MKVLFLCKSNVFRSQMAEAFFNKYSKKHKAESAALVEPQEKMHKLIINALKEKDINITNNKSKKVTREMLFSADKIIVMSRDLLKFLENIPKEKIEVWDIEDIIASEEDEHKFPEIAAKRDLIKKKVKDLVKRMP